jgi:hypothetical protein
MALRLKGHYDHVVGRTKNTDKHGWFVLLLNVTRIENVNFFMINHNKIHIFNLRIKLV